jgi:hypothetical protein
MVEVEIKCSQSTSGLWCGRHPNSRGSKALILKRLEVFGGDLVTQNGRQGLTDCDCH